MAAFCWHDLRSLVKSRHSEKTRCFRFVKGHIRFFFNIRLKFILRRVFWYLICGISSSSFFLTTVTIWPKPKILIILIEKQLILFFQRLGQEHDDAVCFYWLFDYLSIDWYCSHPASGWLIFFVIIFLSWPSFLIRCKQRHMAIPFFSVHHLYSPLW